MKKLLRTLCVGIVAASSVASVQAQIKNSDGDKEHWYNLLSAKSGMTNLAISENSDVTAAFPIAVVAQDPNDHSQQWKFVLVEGSKEYYIVNRKSGKQILTSSLAQGGFNATQLGADESKGFKVEKVAKDQYAIYGTEAQQEGIGKFCFRMDSTAR